MSPRTRDALLWLAGLGGAAVLARALIDTVAAFVIGPRDGAMVGVVVLAIAAALVALALLRSRLAADKPLTFEETRP